MGSQAEDVDFNAIETTGTDTDGVASWVTDGQRVRLAALGNKLFNPAESTCVFICIKEKNEPTGEFGALCKEVFCHVAKERNSYFGISASATIEPAIRHRCVMGRKFPGARIVYWSGIQAGIKANCRTRKFTFDLANDCLLLFTLVKKNAVRQVLLD